MRIFDYVDSNQKTRIIDIISSPILINAHNFSHNTPAEQCVLISRLSKAVLKFYKKTIENNSGNYYFLRVMWKNIAWYRKNTLPTLKRYLALNEENICVNLSNEIYTLLCKNKNFIRFCQLMYSADILEDDNSSGSNEFMLLSDTLSERRQIILNKLLEELHENNDGWLSLIYSFRNYTSSDMAFGYMFSILVTYIGNNEPLLAFKLLQMYCDKVKKETSLTKFDEGFFIYLLSSILKSLDAKNLLSAKLEIQIMKWINNDNYRNIIARSLIFNKIYDAEKVSLKKSSQQAQKFDLKIFDELIANATSSDDILTINSLLIFVLNNTRIRSCLDKFDLIFDILNHSKSIASTNWLFDIYLIDQLDDITRYLSSHQLDRILSNLSAIKNINIYSDSFLAAIAKKYPEKVIYFLINNEVGNTDHLSQVEIELRKISFNKIFQIFLDEFSKETAKKIIEANNLKSQNSDLNVETYLNIVAWHSVYLFKEIFLTDIRADKQQQLETISECLLDEVKKQDKLSTEYIIKILDSYQNSFIELNSVYLGIWRNCEDILLVNKAIKTLTSFMGGSGEHVFSELYINLLNYLSEWIKDSDISEDTKALLREHHIMVNKFIPRVREQENTTIVNRKLALPPA